MTANRKLSAAAAVLAWFLVPSHVLAATTCGTSVASLHGWYGMLVTGGYVTGGTAKYQVGAVLFDGVGGVSGNNVYGAAGSRSAVTGTYVQNADCTLTVDLTIGSTPAVFTVAVASNGEAAGIETDGNAVANIYFRPQYATYTSGLNFTSTSLNGTFAAACSGPLSGSSDLNLVTFANGSLSGTDPYNNGGNFGVANVPYTGSYTVNSDGTFGGSLVVLGTSFDFYGVLSTQKSKVDYIYENVSNGAPIDAFAACVGSSALGASVVTAPFTLTASAPTVSLRQNQGGTDVITVTPAAGFTGFGVVVGLGPAERGVVGLLRNDADRVPVRVYCGRHLSADGHGYLRLLHRDHPRVPWSSHPPPPSPSPRPPAPPRWCAAGRSRMRLRSSRSTGSPAPSALRHPDYRPA